MVPRRGATIGAPLPRIFSRHVSNYFHYRQGDVAGRINLLSLPGFIGHYTSRVNRPYNEDRYSASVLKLPRGSTFAPRSLRKGMSAERQVFNFAVYDGHGSDECSEFLKDKLATYVEKADLNDADDITTKYKERFGGYWRRWKQMDKYRGRMSPYDDFQLRLPLAFLEADYDFEGKGGSTCTSVFLYCRHVAHSEAGPLPPGAEDNMFDPENDLSLVVAHVGDTRCIICDAKGEATPLTIDHHPSAPTEADRLRRFASSFFMDSFGEERFGVFANTRAFGDTLMKAKGVSAEPDVREVALQDEQFLVLVSDGVSGDVSDQEIVDLVTITANSSGSGRGSPQQAAQEVVEYAAALGGSDNATCMVIRLRGWGNGSQVDRTGELREYRLKNVDSRGNRM
ncbi:phosphatase 2C-like domain-containing protein [Yarrowia lipolytica]|jgi:protein phosphatase PTC6|uniref:YALI0B22616p n=2 Tax=Yarrowia lipolytica TaxID=4952 RepID=Q6CDN3_YARLI|nr:YALI0B22616p [Yarrowia lipolytica CLIB122]AOW02083.1 hypothetical protein YALI1_B29528g [Yarrowia lipolytica]KAB8283471.1 phosphatase 2C-like domain-containing protein [Yarrowia lipolytica]KAE8173296.1 phosphatase 2C-like domain-containing protein [Yarrowia lipolytica]KAJ8052845.1 phosphatase 2C-like domain-containing protein [Yarrowia lipolytica]QNP96973.1 Protein phosphatase 2C [Yarrowia lipolytica]|eukprot:XP_501229.1 YALI0B22616p [Yarrowia lipolytica CLIB122]